MAHAHSTTGHTIHWAFLYDLLVSVLFLGRERAVREMTVDLAGLQPGESVLDVGCGTGTLTLAAKRRVGPGVDVYGIDASPEMIVRAQQRAQKAGGGVAFREAPVERMPFLPGQFDVVLSSLMLHHLPDELRPQALAEIRRVLKPRGRFVAVDFQPPRSRLGRALVAHTLGDIMANFEIQTYADLFKAAGFSDIEVGQTGWRLLAYIRARPS
jgi:demethylmenaquinone methyltransferase/2-methoxy-6-polyprenyl-1,4-benzoquinol methylase/phosphoethanolamine N-methyltransferase